MSSAYSDIAHNVRIMPVVNLHRNNLRAALACKRAMMTVFKLCGCEPYTKVRRKISMIDCHYKSVGQKNELSQIFFIKIGKFPPSLCAKVSHFKAVVDVTD